MNAGWSARSVAYFPGYMAGCWQRQMPAMRSGGDRHGELAADVLDQRLEVVTAADRFVPSRKTVNASPPSARKLFVVTR